MTKYSLILFNNRALEITDKETFSLQKRIAGRVPFGEDYRFYRYNWYQPSQCEILLMAWYE